MAYVLRFMKVARNRCKPSVHVSTKELELAEIKVIQFVQAEEFAADCKSIIKYKQVTSNSTLISLAPFIDSSGILRVGGRLQNASCSYNVKHPVILPKGHAIVHLILEYLHKKYLHPGPSLLTALSRQKYWILGVRLASRSICRKCLVCYRHSTLRSSQQMGHLPESRVTPSRPFSIVGVDYAGPISLASKKGRGAKLIKGFIVIFVCFATKALHIEVASDLTTDAFLAALDRFVARRGAPAEIYSDNGSNFLGAKRRLYDHYKLISSAEFNAKINEYAPKQNIRWHFIPPISPHFGGLWERAVRSVKSHLIKVTGNAHLTFEELVTVTTKIEGILNSRPLCAIKNEDICNIDALTPAHFLALGPFTALPCPNYDDINMSRLNRWERIQKLVQTFWRQYSISYLNTLQQRTKWQNKESNLKVDDIVLMHDVNSHPCVWPLGRIIEVHEGNDGIVRVATVRTKSSVFKRHITRLYKLPLDD